MKTSLFSSILCASLLVFAVGCGKENKSGGSRSGAYNNLYNQGLSQTNQQVLQKNVNWFNARTEGLALQGLVNITRTPYTFNTAPNCEEKKFLGIPYQYCSYNSSGTPGTAVVQNNVQLFQDNRAINAKGNTELNAIFSGASGTLVSAIDLSSTASKLDFLRADGTIVSFVIDRSYHSLLNPVKKTETSQAQKVETIVTAQRVTL